MGIVRQPMIIPAQVTRQLKVSLMVAVAFVIITILNFAHSRQLMYDYLENEAVSFGQNLEVMARNLKVDSGDAMEQLLEDNLDNSYLAYVIIYNREKRLIAGSGKVKEVAYTAEVDRVLYGQKTVVRELELAAREKVLEVNMPFHLGRPGKHAKEIGTLEPKFQVLRVGVKQSHASRFIDVALVQVIFAGLIVAVMGVFSYSQMRTLKEYFLLQGKLQNQEKLAAIGLVSAGLAHEIRNPVGAIKGMAQLLVEEDNGQYDRIYYDSILRESVRLEKLVNQLLEYARVKALQISSFEISEILHYAIENVVKQLNINKDRFILLLKEDFIIAGDRTQLEQVLVNLLTNAVQASSGKDPEAPAVVVEAYRSADSFNISIRDRGTGIPAGKEKELFEPFFTTKEKGVGLGLAIAQQIITAHGGRITAFNRGQGGAEFVVTLPLGGRDGEL